MMTAQHIRDSFRKFFESKGHVWIPSASLVPENDPTVLFTTAGMHPLVPYLLGQPHPEGKRLANMQRCLRTDDIDEVGDQSHLTFFEMLGFWSLGDYFKETSIPLTWEWYTGKDWLALDPRRIAVSVFAGDNDASEDSESIRIWLDQPGFPGENRIAKLGKDDNWWPAGGGAGGPCGPDTEIFYWTGEGEAPEVFDPKNHHWVEIGNNVLMEFNRTPDGAYQPLKQKNIDTGLGFERIVTVAQGKNNVFETDLFAPIIDEIRKKATKQSVANERIIADHMRAVIFLAMDGVMPSNKDQGYVMRRLLRRALIKWRQSGVDTYEHGLTPAVAPAIIATYVDAYPQLFDQAANVLETLTIEELKFERTLDEGLHMVDKFKKNIRDGAVSDQIIFQLFTSYGIPPELQPELFDDTELTFDLEGFDRLFAEHQAKSRAGAEQKFKGGLADHSEAVVRLHTATHLLHEALRRVLGGHVEQRGSNITAERLRFDFVQAEKMTEKELKQVEDLVNDLIKQDLPVQREVLSLDEAHKLGARAIFGEKYGDSVSVYSIGPDDAGNYFSREFCGGPHVAHTGEIGQFKIVKEEAVSAGIRRIKASVL